jgi:hypothetical protein
MFKRISLLLSVFIILFLLASSAFASLTDGLVAYYPFNGNANDASGNGNHGAVYGAALTTDRFGSTNSAYSFDGVNTYIDMGVLNINLPVTVSLWFNSSSINALYDTVLGWNDPEDTGIQIMGNGNGKMRFRIGSNMEDVISQSTIDGDGIWHLVTITRENNVMQVYVDGVLEVTSNPSSLIVNAHKLYFGKSFQPDNLNEYFNGKIDDVRIYNRVLSSSEIQQLYNESSLYNGLVAYYPFNSNANDESGNGNHGTVNGATLTTDRFGNANSAYSFDGVNDYITSSNSASQQILANQITLSAWIRLNSDVGVTQWRIVNKQQTNEIAWGLEIFGNGYYGATGNNVAYHDSNGSTWVNCIAHEISLTDLPPIPRTLS